MSRCRSLQYHSLTVLVALAAGVMLFTAQAADATDADEPFGRATIAATEGPLSVTWRRLQEELQADERIVAQCRAEPASCTSPAAQRFIAIVKEGDRRDGLSRIGRINRAVNLALKPLRAEADQSEWTSPLQALTTGTGDCKQYAVVKYAALLDAGIATDNLRLVIVRIKRPRSPTIPTSHLVVAVRLQTHWFILDNRSLTVSDSSRLSRDLEPLFTLDDRGVRQFVPASATPMAAAPCGESLG